MKVRFFPHFAACTIGAACFVSVAHGAVTLTSLPSDASATAANTTTRVSDTAVTAGREGGSNLSAVFVFELPTLLPGQTVANASFTVRIANSNGNPSTNLDLYGLAFRSSGTVLGSDYYSGPLDPSASATFIADSFRTPTGATGNVVISNAILTDYINAQIAAGATTGSYLFLRASSDAVLESNSFYYLGSNSNTTQEPKLSFDIVPEPSTLTLLPLTAAALFFGRRRQH